MSTQSQKYSYRRIELSKTQRQVQTFAIKTLIFFIFSSTMPGLGQVQYQYRGNRYEGVKSRPVSGFDIELISALADYQEDTPTMPEKLSIKFYLTAPALVSVTVRELDYKDYYWMDRVKPAEPWTTGFSNFFEWPTSEVLQYLENLSVYDLGVVIRLEKPEPSKVERIAPAILYHSQYPSAITGYLFTLRPNGDARLTCSIYREGEAQPTFTQIFPRQRAGRPFTCRWQCQEESEDFYKLLVQGYFLDSNEPITQIVYFYHRPTIE